MIECPYTLADNGNGVFDIASYQAAMAMCPPVRVSAEAEEKVRRLHYAVIGSGEVTMTFIDWEKATLEAAGMTGKLPGDASALYRTGLRPADAAKLLDTAHIADMIEARGWPRFINPEKFGREARAEVAQSLENNPILDGAMRGVAAPEGAENPYVEFSQAWHAWNWGFEKRAEMTQA